MKKTDMEWEELLRNTYKETETPGIVSRRVEDALESIRMMEYARRTEQVQEMDEERKLLEAAEKAETIVRPRHFSFKKTAVIAAAAALIVGGTSFAAEKLYHMFITQEAAHESTLDLSAEAAIPDEVPTVTVKTNYIPAGLTLSEKEYYVNDEGNCGYGIGAEPLLLDTADPLTLLDVVSAESLTIGDRDAIRVTSKYGLDADWKSTDIFVAYPEYHRILVGYCWGYADEAELIRMLEETELVAEDTMIDASTLTLWSEYVTHMNESYVAAESDEDRRLTQATAEEMARTHAMQESFPVRALFDDSALEDSPVYACVTDVTITDRASGAIGDLTAVQQLKEEYADRFAGDGTLLPDTLQYYILGDGSTDYTVSTLREEDTDVRLVCATIDYTNVTDETLQDVYFNCSIIPMQDQADGSSKILSLSGEDYDGTQNKNWVGWEMYTWDIDGAGSLKNYIPEIAPGETVPVHVCFVLNESELNDQLYLDLTAHSSIEFWPGTLEQGMVKAQ